MTTIKTTRIERQLQELAELLPASFSVGTTAPRAPWNATGQRLWEIRNNRGSIIASAQTFPKIRQAARAYGRQG